MTVLHDRQVLGEAGFNLQLVDERTQHYRVNLRKGDWVDYWPGPGRWRQSPRPSGKRAKGGHGVETMLAHLKAKAPKKLKAAAATRDVRCADDGQQARLTSGAEVYPHRDDLHGLWFYVCPACSARVGCHKMGDGMSPLGTPAGPATRTLRSRCHALLDPMWERAAERDKISIYRARGHAYRWLAEQLGLEGKDTHIGMFDADTCRRAIALLEAIWAKAKAA